MSESFEVFVDNEWKKIDGNPLDYAKENAESIVLYKKKIVCFFKDNIDIGKLIDNIMKGLRIKKIKDCKVYVYPINYYVLDYVDPLSDDGYIAVEL